YVTPTKTAPPFTATANGRTLAAAKPAAAIAAGRVGERDGHGHDVAARVAGPVRLEGDGDQLAGVQIDGVQGRPVGGRLEPTQAALADEADGGGVVEPVAAVGLGLGRVR